MSNIYEIQGEFAQLQKRYKEHLPKVDPALIHDLLLRQIENSGVAPIYMLEVFTKPGIDVESARDYIFSKTGMRPAVFDNGTHFATNQKLTLEILKEISDSDDVIEITGDHTGSIGAYPVSHEHEHKERRSAVRPVRSEQSTRSAAQVEDKVSRTEGTKANDKQYMWAIYTAVGIVGALVLAGAILSGGMPPNVNVPTAVPGEQAILYGYIGGPGGLPAVGTTIVAAEQQTGYTVNEFVSIDGNYYFDVPAGTYIVLVAYPDGTNRIVHDYVVERGSSNQLDFSY